MITIFSLVTSVKDYVDVIHKIIESDNNFQITNYFDIGPIITYIVITLKELIINFVSLNWLKNVWDLPIIVPDISSAMISEISVLDGFLHNSFNFLDRPISYGDSNLLISYLEKFSIGIINSLFLFIPTSAAHLITIRRFVMQGLEAGYLSGLGAIAGNLLWISSIIFGWRFIVIPWISIDIFRYLLGFILLIKYMWDSYNEKKTNITSPIQKQKIFILNFLLAFTEQTNIYPFISNLSIGSESSILESFPVSNYFEFISIHSSYIIGLSIGSLILLHFTCWFWENPAFKIYLWVTSSPKFKVNSTFYYRIVNFIFLYLTMISAISSIPYYGLDYTLTNPLGFVQDDRTLDQKNLLETSFLSTKASDRNTRRNRGRHGRRERWKRRIRKYRTFDASLYDQGIYDLFTIEDLNYGFDRFWLRRKMRNHRVRSRFFPGGWMRSFKKQLAKPRLESYTGPRQEFFRILFEQVYHPIFHEYKSKNEKTQSKLGFGNNRSDLSDVGKQELGPFSQTNLTSNLILNKRINKFINLPSFIPLPQGGGEGGMGTNYSETIKDSKIKELQNFSKKTNGTNNFKLENSIFRKFYRKNYKRIRSSEIKSTFNSKNSVITEETLSNNRSEFIKQKNGQNIYSKRWKYLFSQIAHGKNNNSNSNINSKFKGTFENIYQTALTNKSNSNSKNTLFAQSTNLVNKESNKNNSKIYFSNSEKQILKYRSLLFNSSKALRSSSSIENSSNLLHPLKYYVEKQNRFEKKLKNYTPTIFRKFGVENNSPYFRIMMNRYFYYYKPTLRWERTMKVASLRKARRKTATNPKRIQLNNQSVSLDTVQLNTNNNNSNTNNNLSNRITTKTHNYTIVGKRAFRYRYQIYKDVLQHWYYSPFNRLLLKFDIDLFINRQPNSHFLTKEEETLLHLRRLLLSEHYDTLRWYSYMQHYRAMKTKIGGTKSFASRTYNQQFSGTFKKIRHLFAITPSQGTEPILKFDQILYNDKLNSSSNNSQKNLVIHEELLSPYLSGSSINSSTKRDDLLNNSMKIIQDYLTNTKNIKKEYIKKLIQDKNYLDLTKFLYKGQKTRGSKAVLTEKTFLSQEKEYLLTTEEKDELKKLEKLKLEKFLSPLQENLWINVLKNWKRKINDQEFLKNYLQRRLDKRKKRTEMKEKTLETKMQRLESQLFSSTSSASPYPLGKGKELEKKIDILNSNKDSNKNLSTSVEKALLEGVYLLKNKKINLMKNSERQSFKQNLNWETNKIDLVNNSNETAITSSPSKLNQVNFNVDKLRFKNLDSSIILEKEKTLNRSLKTLLNLFSLDSKKQKLTFPIPLPFPFAEGEGDGNNTGIHLRSTNLKKIQTKINGIYKNIQKRSQKVLIARTKNIKTFLMNFKLTGLFLEEKNENKGSVKRKQLTSLRNWQKSERALNKEKRSRKEFDLFSKKQFKTNSKNYEKYVQRKTDLILSSKRSRTELNNDLTISNSNKLNEPNRKKRDQTLEEGESLKVSEITKENLLKKIYSRYFTVFGGNKFKRKKSPQRRSRISRNRGVTKKRTLSDSLRREFKNLRKYGEKIDNKKEKIYLNLNSNLNKQLNTNGLFSRNPLQRRSKQKKQRFWKQKRSKYSQKLRKYKKRRRSIVGKIRILNKQLKKIKTSLELKQWWWKNFLPNLRATTDSLWQYEKDRQVQQKLSELSIPEILERENSIVNNQIENFNLLQIGDYDYKPLSVPASLKMIQSITKANSFEDDYKIDKNYKQLQSSNNVDLSTNKESFSDIISKLSENQFTNSLNPVSNNVTSLLNKKDDKNSLFIPGKLENQSDKEIQNKQNKIIPTTNLPFYAGWDESERKFIVTNRLLSRREAGYQMNYNLGVRSIPFPKGEGDGTTQSENKFKIGQKENDITNELNRSNNDKLFFENAPLNGMNAATTLYWQTPFTTYDPDQFFALGMDGFAPIGWRRFQFRHSLLKSWLYDKNTKIKNSNNIVIKNKINIINKSNKRPSFDLNSQLLYKLTERLNPILTNRISFPSPSPLIFGDGVGDNKNNLFENSQSSSKIFYNPHVKNIYRRLKKRYRRVKKHPRSPAWFPSGPLLTQVLPVHYIYIFYKRSRLPRDRYLKRRLQKVKTNTRGNVFLQNIDNEGQIPDFTLRKRVKTKRKYHLKQNINTAKSILIPRRMKFIGFSSPQLSTNNKPSSLLTEETDKNAFIRWRPLSRQKINKSVLDLIREQRALNYQQRKKNENSSNNTQSSNIRIKQLRRRVQRQIIRSVWRHKPLAGGFVWPGDYLKLELIKTPKLKLDFEKSSNKDEIGKAKKKKKRMIPEAQIQSKKYLLEKHNSNVIKKKLAKAQRTNKIQERIKQLNLIV